MDPTKSIVALESLVAVAGTLLIWNFLWPRLAADAARQHLFAIRDKLFLIALHNENGVRFNSDAYRARRKRINAMIHSIGHLNLWALCGIALVELVTSGFKRRNISSQFPEAGLEPDAIKKLHAIDKETKIATLKYFTLRSPLSSGLVFVLITVGVFLYVMFVKIRRAFEARGNSIREPIFCVNEEEINPSVAKEVITIRRRIRQSIATEVSAVVERADEFDEEESEQFPTPSMMPSLGRHFRPLQHR
jgi:hypothetical protein